MGSLNYVPARPYAHIQHPNIARLQTFMALPCGQQPTGCADGNPLLPFPFPA
jgi:hypothetical protein